MKKRNKNLARQKREAEELPSFPTLGLVAEEEDFAPLRGLLQGVAGRPVNEFSTEMRDILRQKAGEGLDLVVASFFAACDARVAEMERKRARLAARESQGEQRKSFQLSLRSVLFVGRFLHLLLHGSERREHCGWGSFFSLIGLLGSSSKEVTALFEKIKGCNVLVANTLVDPPNGKQWLCGLEVGQPLFVRECYAWFYEEAIRKMDATPKCRGLIYTGNPGIGKSVWLNYALVRFLQDDYAVVLERAKMSDYFVFRDGVCSHQEKRVRISVLEELPEKSVYLFDPDENDSHPLECNVFTIVASSPQEKHYKALFKRGANVRYFPCWQLEELISAKPFRITQEEIKERFDVWGGIPRFIFAAAQEELKVRLSKAITGMDLKLVQKYLLTPEMSEDDQKTISHMVVQYRIIDSSSFSRCELDFASPAIGRAVIQAVGQANYSALITHYESVRRLEWQGAYAGHLWEHLCHKILPLGNSDGLQLVPLSPDRKKNVRIIKKALEVECGSMSDLKRVLDSGKYFKPKATNFAVIDAAVKEDNVVYGFQMTVARAHPPKAHEVAELFASCPSIHLVWVVDAAKNDHIKALQGFEQSRDPDKEVDAEMLKRLKKIPQWLLKLEFPKENPFVIKSELGFI